MMQDNIDISELYDSGAISGETYLYCVEHDLNTIQDLSSCDLNDASELVLSELMEFRVGTHEDSNQCISKVEASDTNSSIEYKLYFLQTKINDGGEELHSYFDELKHYYIDEEKFIIAMLACKRRQDLPYWYNQPSGVVNVALNIIYDLQNLDRFSAFDKLFTRCTDVRCTNVLKKRYNEFGNKMEFIDWLVTCTQADLYRLNNIGAKSVHIIWTIIQELKNSGIAPDDAQIIEQLDESSKDVLEEFNRFLCVAGYKHFFNIDLVVRSYIRDLINYYGDIYTFVQKILTYSKRSDLPFYDSYSRDTLNHLLDFIYDLKVLGKKYLLFDEIFSLCQDTRSVMLLKTQYGKLGNKLEFINWLLNCKPIDLIKLRNVGRKTLNVIRDLSKELCEMVAENLSISSPLLDIAKHLSDLSEEVPDESLDDKFQWAVEAKRRTLSVRANNVLDGIIAECQGSYASLYKLFVSSHFSFIECRNCGRKTAKELGEFRYQILSVVGSTSLDEMKSHDVHDRYKRVLSLSDNIVADVITLQEKLNYFPVFYVLQKYIENLTLRDRTILQGLIDIYDGQILRNKQEVGQELKISGERVRQLRNSVLSSVKSYIMSLGKIVEEIHYLPYQSDNINFNEGTNFQDNFIYWAISLISDKWTIIGDVDEVFLNPHGHQVNLNIVPSVLSQSYNFGAFIEEFRRIYIRKRTVDEELNLQSFCMHFYKGAFQIALFDDIIYECKRNILRLFNCTSRGDSIILESNAYRGLSEIAEEILREHGSPMTADEMYAILLEKYPNQRCKGANSLVGSIHHNSNILPMGRSRTYSLKEWNLGTKRGGTIREFAEEYILMQQDKIASLEDIGNYVRQFRETSSNSSIQANLLAEASGKFVLYVKEEVRYVGFSGRTYESSYVLVEETRAEVRSFETSVRLFKQFIEDYGRFPFYAKGDEIDEEEKRLRRFWNNTIYRAKRGDATEDELKFIKEVEDAYPYHDIPRNEYKWREMHKSICDSLSRDGRDSLTSTEQNWCYKYLRMLNQGQLEDWQVPLMIKLQSLYA